MKIIHLIIIERKMLLVISIIVIIFHFFEIAKTKFFFSQIFSQLFFFFDSVLQISPISSFLFPNFKSERKRMRRQEAGPSGILQSPSKPQLNRADSFSSSLNPLKEKQKAPSDDQPPAQLTPLEQAVQDVKKRIDFLVAYAEKHGVDLDDLLETDKLLKKLEANADRLKLRAPSPEGDDLSFLFFSFFFFSR